MKKTISMLLALGTLAAVPWSAFAGGGHYGHGGGHGGYYYGGGAWPFFVGLIGGAIISSAIANSQPAVAYAPPPAAHAPPPEQVWVPGRYETRYERQWVPGHWEVERYSRSGLDEDDDGYRDARQVWVGGHYREVQKQVWVPGHWEERG